MASRRLTSLFRAMPVRVGARHADLAGRSFSSLQESAAKVQFLGRLAEKMKSREWDLSDLKPLPSNSSTRTLRYFRPETRFKNSFSFRESELMPWRWIFSRS